MDIKERHNRLKNILIDYGSDEWGDNIVDDICALFEYPTTTDIEKSLFETDYVIYDKANDQLIRFETERGVVVFGSKDEAYEECRDNEIVISCIDLPQRHQETLLKQINK